MMSLSKEEQIHLADVLLSKLEVVSPYVIVAGGAPRDWYLNQTANDLDIYLYTSADTLKAAIRQIATALQIDISKIEARKSHEESLYTTMRCLRKILDVKGYPMPVQIMLLKDPCDEFKVVDLMSTSICKIYYKDFKFQLKRDFLLTTASKIMFVDDGYKWSDPHPNKIAERFKDEYYVGTKQQAIDQLINKMLREEIKNA